MKHVSAGIKIGILFIAVTTLGYYTFKSLGTDVGSDVYHLTARFKDAEGLPEASRVKIAGLPIGEIGKRSLEGRKAVLTLRIKSGTQIYDNAIVFKKQTSLLGEYYLDIDPGAPVDTKGKTHVLLKDGDELKNVVEATSTDELIRNVNQVIPTVEETVLEVKGLAAATRELINGPIKDMANRLNDTVARESELIHQILQRIDRIAANVENISGDINKGDRIDRIVENILTVTEDAKSLLAATQGEITMTGEKVREKLDRIDNAIAALEDTLEGTASVARKIDEDEGTLGRLVNDSTIADNIEEITEDVQSFVKTAFGLQAYIGIRYELPYYAASARTGLSIELFTRPDKFYLIELVDDPRGVIEDTYVYNDGTSTLERQTVVQPRDLRITFQFAKIYEPFTFRVGLKESTGGIGVDWDLVDDRLTISADVFDTDFNKLPRLRLQAAYNFFKYLYIYAGVDDALNDRQEIDIDPPNLAGQDPQYIFGRDFYAGARLRFSDADLSALLFIGGSAIAGAIGN